MLHHSEGGDGLWCSEGEGNIACPTSRSWVAVLKMKRRLTRPRVGFWRSRLPSEAPLCLALGSRGPRVINSEGLLLLLFVKQGDYSLPASALCLRGCSDSWCCAPAGIPVQHTGRVLVTNVVVRLCGDFRLWHIPKQLGVVEHSELFQGTRWSFSLASNRSWLSVSEFILCHLFLHTLWIYPMLSMGFSHLI